MLRTPRRQGREHGRQIEAKAGEFYIQEKVWFQLRQTDAGTEIGVCDARVDRRYAICLDEDGCIVHGEVQGLSQKVPEAPAKAIVAPPIITRHAEADDVNSFYRSMEKRRNRPLHRFKTLAKHRFTLRWGKNARPRNKCFPNGVERPERNARAKDRRQTGFVQAKLFAFLHVQEPLPLGLDESG